MAKALSSITKLSEALTYANQGYTDALKSCPSAATSYKNAASYITMLSGFGMGTGASDTDATLVANAVTQLKAADASCSANKVVKTTGTGLQTQQNASPPPSTDNSWLWWVLLAGAVVGGAWWYADYNKKHKKGGQ